VTLPELIERKDFVVYFMETAKGKHLLRINCANYAPFNTYQVGDYVKIKLKDVQEGEVSDFCF